jgi:cell division protease FtsH
LKWRTDSLVPTQAQGVMNAMEKEIVPIHESGHAMMNESVEHVDPVHNIWIIPHGIATPGSARPPHRPSPPEHRPWRDV